jgi:hypothetical protein
MRDGSFGELFVDGERPKEWTNVFASVQSIKSLDFDNFGPNSFDMVIVDEFHHASESNASYARVLNNFKPKYLLGLTATPERTDGANILEWFDEGQPVELRLWEAIDRQILSPFQYFGINDNVDIEAAGVTWKRGFGYNTAELSNLYTGNDARVVLILEQMNKYVDDLAEMKAIGFCVSVEHAKYMADKFEKAGIPSASVTGDLDSESRKNALVNLRNGTIKVIFAVDIFNEGVDIPDINTLLMLRPTESATVFIQQLGRGLRKADNKNCLTVLDFVGHQSKEFRFDQKYGKFFGLGRKKLAAAVEEDFPYLPTGCHFELDRVSKEQVLGNLRSALNINKNYLIAEVKAAGATDLRGFVESSGIAMSDIYKNGNSFTLLRNLAFEEGYTPSSVDTDVSKALGRNLHIDDPIRVENYRQILTSSELLTENPYFSMMGYAIFGTSVKPETMASRIQELRSSALKDEFVDYLDLLDEQRNRTTIVGSSLGSHLSVHATYSRGEIVSSFKLSYTGGDVGGVRYAPQLNADIAYVTLNKTETHFSASTMYADTAISDHIFQWESQSRTSDTSETGQRYINHKALGSTFHLFVREFRNDPETGETMPYMYFGPATYMSHEGSKPMRIRWHLDYAIPADVLAKSKVIAS